MTAWKPNSRGLSLLEILIVLAIGAILVALIIPAVNGGRVKAQSAKCLSNLRQVGIGLQLYMGDNGKTPELDPVGWQGYGVGMADKSSKSWTTALVDPGYVPDKRAFFCPAATAFQPTMTTPNGGISAYACQLVNVNVNSVNSIANYTYPGDSVHAPYYKGSNVPLVLEYMAVHPHNSVQGFFCDGSAQQVDNALKAYGPSVFDTGIGMGGVLIYFRK